MKIKSKKIIMSKNYFMYFILDTSLRKNSIYICEPNKSFSKENNYKNNNYIIK